MGEVKARVISACIRIETVYEIQVHPKESTLVGNRSFKFLPLQIAVYVYIYAVFLLTLNRLCGSIRIATDCCRHLRTRDHAHRYIVVRSSIAVLSGAFAHSSTLGLEVFLASLLELVDSLVAFLVVLGTGCYIHSSRIHESQRIVANIGVHVPLLRVQQPLRHDLDRVRTRKSPLRT